MIELPKYLCLFSHLVNENWSILKQVYFFIIFSPKIPVFKNHVVHDVFKVHFL